MEKDQNQKEGSIFDLILKKDLQAFQEFLLVEGQLQDINQCDSLGDTPLFYSVRERSIPFVEILLVSGADLCHRNDKGQTPLMLASFVGLTEAAQIFILSGASVDDEDVNGKTALMYATLAGHSVLVNLLQKSGATLNKKDKGGRSAIYYGVLGSQDSSLEQLPLTLEDRNILNKMREGQEDEIHQKNILEILNELNSHGVSFDLQDSLGQSPLHYAAQEGKEELMSFLIKSGCDLFKKNLAGQAPDDILRINGQLALQEKMNNIFEKVKKGEMDGLTDKLKIPKGAKNPFGSLIDSQDISFPAEGLSPDDQSAIDGQDLQNIKVKGKAKSDGLTDKLKISKGAKNPFGSLIDPQNISFPAEGLSPDDQSAIDGQDLTMVSGGEKSELGNTIKKKSLTGTFANDESSIIKSIATEYSKMEEINHIQRVGGGDSSASINDIQVVKKINPEPNKPMSKIFTSGAVASKEKVLEKENEKEKVKDKTGGTVNSSPAKPDSRLPMDVNKKDDQGLTILMKASAQGNQDAVKALIENGADLSLRDYNGYTALMYAIHGGHLKVVQLLAPTTKNLELKSSNGYTPLALATVQNRTEIMELLIDKGANYQVSIKGMDLLMLAAYHGAFKALKVLLAKGVSPNNKDYRGKAAAQYALAGNHQAIAKLLQQLMKKGIEK